MVKKIIWTSEAEKSLDSVIEYLQKHWSPKETRNFLEKLNTLIHHIEHYPLAFRTTGKDDSREALITKQNLLLYRVSGETLYLLYIWDTRKNPIKKPLK